MLRICEAPRSVKEQAVSHEQQGDPAPPARSMVIPGSLTVLAVGAVIQLTGLPTLDRPQRLAVGCFAVALPLLVVQLLMTRAKSKAERPILVPDLLERLLDLGSVAAVCGAAMLFWHVSALVFWLFVVVSMFATALFVWFIDKAEESVMPQPAVAKIRELVRGAATPHDRRAVHAKRQAEAHPAPKEPRGRPRKH